MHSIYVKQRAQIETNAALATNINSIRKQRIRIRMVQVLRSTQAAHKVIPIPTVVIRALNLPQVRALMDISRRLVLRVARPRQRRQLIKVQVAIRHVARARQRIRKHLSVASPVDVRAVVPAHPRGGGAALGCDPAKDVGHGVARVAG